MNTFMRNMLKAEDEEAFDEEANEVPNSSGLS